MGRRSRSRRMRPALIARLGDVPGPLGEIMAPANRGRRVFDAHLQAHLSALRFSLRVEEQPSPRTPYSTCQFTTLSAPQVPMSGATSSTAAPQRGLAALTYQADEFTTTSTVDHEIAEGEE